MIVPIRRVALALAVTGGAVALSMQNLETAAPACDPDNGGLKLPGGFCGMEEATRDEEGTEK